MLWEGKKKAYLYLSVMLCVENKAKTDLIAW